MNAPVTTAVYLTHAYPSSFHSEILNGLTVMSLIWASNVKLRSGPVRSLTVLYKLSFGHNNMALSVSILIPSPPLCNDETKNPRSRCAHLPRLPRRQSPLSCSDYRPGLQPVMGMGIASFSGRLVMG